MIAYYSKILVAFLIFSLGERLLFLFGFADFMSMPLTAWMSSGFNGLRFDFMVISYLMVPHFILIFTSNWAFSSGDWTYKLSSWYFFGIFAGVGLITVFDFFHMRLLGDRINMEGLHTHWMAQPWLSLFDLKFLAACGLSVVWTLGWCKRVTSDTPEYSWPIAWNKFLILGAFLFLGARGSFSAHHLDLRYAIVSDDAMVNLSVIPSSYALDQALRGRR